MTDPDITRALVTESGLMALVVVLSASMAVGLAKWVLDAIADSRKDKP